MAAVMTLYTFGGEEVLVNLFNGIAVAVGSTAYTTLLKIAALFGFVYVIMESVFRQDFMLNIRWFITFFLVYQIMLVPKVTLDITNPINGSHQIVDHVPLGLAFFSSTASLMGYSLTQMTESVFTLPNDLRYSETGSLMASHIVKETLDARIQNPMFAKNMQHFVEQCVFYDILLGKYTIQDITQNVALWPFIESQTSLARAFRYDNRIVSCRDGVAMLRNDFQQEISTQKGLLGMRLFPEANNPALLFEEYLPIGMSYLSQISQSQYDILEQSLMIKAVQDGLLKQGTRLDSGATVQGFATLRANQIKESAYMTTGLLASRWLAIMQNVFEALFYGAFLFLSLLFLMPWGAQLLKGYVLSLFWLQSWAPLYAILNLVMTVNARTHSLGILNTGEAGLTLDNLHLLSQTQQDTMALAGFLSMSIPFIAYGIVKGGASAFTHLATHIGNVSQSAATRAAEEVTSGNLSFGNTQFANHSMQNTHGFQYQMNPLTQSGMVNSQLPSGAMVHRTADGTNVIDSHSAISTGASQLNLSESLRGVAQSQADSAITNTAAHTQHYADTLNTEFRDMQDVSTGQSQLHMNDQATGHSDSQQFSSSMQAMQQVHQEVGQRLGLNESASARLVGMAHALGKLGFSSKNMPVDFGLSLTGNLGLECMSNAERHQALNEAFNIVNNSNYAEHFDNAERTYMDISQRDTSESGLRMSNNLSDSMARGEQYRQEAMSSYQQAQNYHRTASLSKENSIMQNANLMQGFVDWLGTQPSSQHSGQTMSANEIEQLINHPSKSLDGMTHSYLSDVSTQLSSQMSGDMKAMMQPHSSIHFDEKMESMTMSHDDNQSLLEQSYDVGRITKNITSPEVNAPLEVSSRPTLSASQEEIMTKEKELQQTLKDKMDPEKTSLLRMASNTTGAHLKGAYHQMEDALNKMHGFEKQKLADEDDT